MPIRNDIKDKVKPNHCMASCYVMVLV